MSFITFIYKLENCDIKYYGKYCFDYISDDHEGLDLEVQHVLLKGINKHRKRNNMEKLTAADQIDIGILCFARNQYIPVYSTDREIRCFDFYCEDYERIPTKYYVNGELL
jgi:hypothetical protein